MGKNLGTKLAIIAAVLLFFIYGIVGPHSTEHGFKYSFKQTIAENIRLGLDLKGGTHLVIRVHEQEAVTSAVDRDSQRIQAAIAAIAPTATVSRPEPKQPYIVVAGMTPQQSSSVRSILGGNEYSQYDLAGQPDGSLKLSMKQAALNDLDQRTLDTTIEVINDRINKLGVSESVVQRYGLGEDQILVELPGVDDPAAVEAAIQSTDKLEIHAVDGSAAGYDTDQDAITGLGGTLPPGRLPRQRQRLRQWPRPCLRAQARGRSRRHRLPRRPALHRHQRPPQHHLQPDDRGRRPLLHLHRRA